MMSILFDSEGLGMCPCCSIDSLMSSLAICRAEAADMPNSFALPMYLSTTLSSTAGALRGMDSLAFILPISTAAAVRLAIMRRIS